MRSPVVGDRSDSSKALLPLGGRGSTRIKQIPRPGAALRSR
ncbi:hypothetical protein [Rhodococcus coprophilus]|nr:hypothetical protein [Rhodococcus coprophilus]